MANEGATSEHVLKLSLDELREGACLAEPGPTAHWASCAAAASMCLVQNSHTPPQTTFAIQSTEESLAILDWAAPSQPEQRGWTDPYITAEWGAYGMAALLIGRITSYRVLERARRNGGYDFWLSKDEKEEELPFQGAARLEVSGIMCGQSSHVRARVQKKLTQIAKAGASLPRFVAVVEFSEPRAVVIEK
jgi:hypothetical protein